MSERDGYNDGEFCWVDLATPDLERAASFYADLIGWEFEPAEAPEGVDIGGYGNFTHKGKAVAGMARIMEQGQPPAWSSYVKVSDSDATADKVRDAGGTLVLGPLDIPGGAGRMMACQDAEGAFISTWEPGSHRGAELVNEIGCWTWNNLATRDLEQAKGFYREVFGWEATHSDQAPDFIWNWQIEGQRWPEGLGGLQEMGADVPAQVPPHWEVYFLVPDLEEAMELTRRAGGQVTFGPLELPVAKLALLTDPDGAALGLMEPDYPEPR